jgi:hypothetical protein
MYQQRGGVMLVRTFVVAVVTVLAALIGTACHAVGELTGHAADEWVRSYPLTPGGAASCKFRIPMALSRSRESMVRP